MSKDAKFYKEKWEKCQERCEILEEENRWRLQALEEFRNLSKENAFTQASISHILEPVESPESTRRTCLFCAGNISPYKRRDSRFCSTGCRNNANSHIAYHRKKARVKVESE